MIARADLIGVALVAFGMVVTPGPNMIYVVSRSITQGRRAGLISLTGVAAGFVAYVCAAAVGLSAVFAAVPALYVGVKLAGACYLGWLAWQAVRPGGVSLFAPVELPHDSPRRLFTMGLLTNLLNPKAAILYASLLPQFIDVRAGHVAQQVLVLGAVQICVSLLVNGTRHVRGQRRRLPAPSTRLAPRAALRGRDAAGLDRGEARDRQGATGGRLNQRLVRPAVPQPPRVVRNRQSARGVIRSA